ncbi:uncharacterized protein LOC115255401 isoform X2 [Aedes albopictus]|uniref:ER-bound oxygenase mpaB/mpaB'/Rubber oxygenase catalytic domain-containing protein n=1 Tax=Aedes albopictus TaxID=7160 RepID=A0ABM1ZD25_AEDAL|nr:uncharacterized protein LOC115255401 isoform X2 [Aedes albopictus]
MDKSCSSNFLYKLTNIATRIPVDKHEVNFQISLPPWFDRDKFKRGQRFFRNNYVAIMAAHMCGLVTVFAALSILKVLIFTKQSATPAAAYKRYYRTVLHIQSWYFEELEPASNSWKSLEYVRRIHAVSGKNANAADSRMLISQKDVAITQFGFVGYVVLNHRKLGVQYSREGVEGFVHLWRTIGYMLGLEDRFNLCTEDFDTSVQRMTLVNDHFFRPGLQNPSADFDHMTRIMIDGMWCYSTLLNYDAFMFMTRRLSNVPGHYYWNDEPRDGAEAVYKDFSWFSRVMLNVLMVIHEVLLNYTVTRWFANWFFLFNTTVANKYFPVLAMVTHGFRKAYVKIVY